MTLAAPVSPDCPPALRFDAELGWYEPDGLGLSDPPSPAISAVHLALDFLASMAGAFLMTIGVAFLIGAVR